MNLTELTTPAAASYPLGHLKDHLRLSGLSDDGSQDALLEGYLATAISMVEARTGKVLLDKNYVWEITRWHSDMRQGLPVVPVTAITQVALVDLGGVETVIDPARYALRKDGFRPELTSPCLPVIPGNGSARIAFVAGYGPNWTDVPHDLAQAVVLLASYLYGNRGECGAEARALPIGVTMILERYRTTRLVGDSL
ncbi:head-tail connector protein [Halovulum sp. GXIMD14793]